MAEFVRDDALQLVAGEFFEPALGHGDHRIGGGEARGKGVDARFMLKDEHGRHGHTGGDGHLLDDVEQAAFREVGGVGGDAPAADHLGDRRTAAAHLAPLEKRSRTDDHDRAARDPGENHRTPETDRCGGIVMDVFTADLKLAEERHGRGVTREDGAQHRQAEKDDEPGRALPGEGLGFEEVHVEGSLKDG